MERIRKWLNEKGTYQAGVDLLLDIHPDHHLAELFTGERETSFKAKKLKQLLQDLLHTSPKGKSKPDLARVSGPSHQVKQLQEQVDDLNDQLEDLQGQVDDAQDSKTGKQPGRWSHPDDQDAVERSLHQGWHPLYLERSNLQARIYDVAQLGKKDPKQKDAAAAMAFRILELDRKIKSYYDQRDQYFTTGSLPDEPPAEQYAQDPVIAARKLQNHERYARTFKKQLEKDPADDNARKLLNKHQKAIEHYKTFLKIQ